MLTGSDNKKSKDFTGHIMINSINGSFFEYNSDKTGFDTGYSLFDADFVKYWRYLGWNSPHQREVTRHQTSGVVDTSKSVFEKWLPFSKRK